MTDQDKLLFAVDECTRVLKRIAVALEHIELKLDER